MTISSWVAFSIVSLIIIFISIFVYVLFDSNLAKFLGIFATVALIIVAFCGGRRELIDQKSELANGLDRIVNIYTANGDIIATYEGKIDLEDNDGGYVIFDLEGKRYMYYNCFVESIADIT